MDGHPDQFPVLGRTYLIAPAGRPVGAAAAVQSVRQVTVRRGGKPIGAYTPLFTDRLRAERFVARLPDATALRLMAVRTPPALAVVLGRLLECGESHVLIDPDPPTRTGLLFTVPAAIRALVARHRGGNSNTDARP